MVNERTSYKIRSPGARPGNRYTVHHFMSYQWRDKRKLLPLLFVTRKGGSSGSGVRRRGGYNFNKQVECGLFCPR